MLGALVAYTLATGMTDQYAERLAFSGRLGQIEKGMSRTQVVKALGAPNFTIDLPHYWRSHRLLGYSLGSKTFPSLGSVLLDYKDEVKEVYGRKSPEADVRRITSNLEKLEEHVGTLPGFNGRYVRTRLLVAVRNELRTYSVSDAVAILKEVVRVRPVFRYDGVGGLDVCTEPTILDNDGRLALLGIALVAPTLPPALFPSNQYIYIGGQKPVTLVQDIPVVMAISVYRQTSTTYDDDFVKYLETLSAWPPLERTPNYLEIAAQANAILEGTLRGLIASWEATEQTRLLEAQRLFVLTQLGLKP